MNRSDKPAVGIDLGTTYSVVAYLDRDGRPRTIPNEEGELITPSAVFFDRSGPIVGREAVRAGALEPARVAYFAKRDIGERQYSRTICGQEFPPEVIESLVLRKLHRDAGLKLGEFRQAVVTVPAYFNEPRRKATQDAGRLAGLDVIDIINEPTAAAIAYGCERGLVTTDGPGAGRERLLVYDLGGGTFDVTLMEIDGAHFRAVAIAGDVYLGGIDWDQRIVEHVAQVCRQRTGLDPQSQPADRERLRHAACEAKHALTVREETIIPLHCGVQQLQVRLTRAEFESLTGDLLDRTRLTVRRLLKDAHLAWSDLTRLLLVGGATRMPMVQRMLAEESGLPPDRSLSPDEAVAHGAAIYAGWLLRRGEPALRGMSVRNVNAHTLGVLGVDPETGRPRRKLMIPRNTPLPAAVTRSFRTLRDGQQAVLVRVVEGGTDSGAHATQIGTCVVTELPPALPSGTPVHVTFRYGQDGRLTVQASLPGLGCQAKLTIQRVSGLTEGQIEKWSELLREGLPAPAESDGNADRNQSAPDIFAPDTPAPPVALPVAADHGVPVADLAVALPDEADPNGDEAAARPRPEGEDLDNFLSGLGK